MITFDKFRDAVFLKEDSNLELQLEQLKMIREQLIDRSQINKDIKFLIDNIRKIKIP